MQTITQPASISDIRTNPQAVFDQAQTQGMVPITRRSKISGVLFSYDEYLKREKRLQQLEKWLEDEYLTHVFGEAEKEYDTNKQTKHTSVDSLIEDLNT